MCANELKGHIGGGKPTCPLFGNMSKYPHKMLCLTTQIHAKSFNLKMFKYIISNSKIMGLSTFFTSMLKEANFLCADII